MDGFYASLPTFATFARIVDTEAYRPLPDEWVVGIADVVSSTEAVAQGRYKAVNLAGAAVISAVSNMLGTLDYPYVFTGDGMVCALPPDRDAALRRTLGVTLGWIGGALDLAMRAATVPVATIRASGFDVRIARFKPSPDVAYAMFSGGGIAWADAALKSGILPAVPQVLDDKPDLSGLSCRFKPMPARQGTILSLIVAPKAGTDPATFARLVGDILAIVGEGAGNPVPENGPYWGWPPDNLDLEARMQRRPGRALWSSRAMLGLRTLAAAAIVRIGRPIGAFSPARYRSQIAPNSDFRKFEDGLMMTLDCPVALADAIEARLIAARTAGLADFGAHRQAAALLTCVVPVPSRSDHVHFVDGAGGGYTVAARNLKQSRQDAAARRSGPYLAHAPSGALL
jgi:hypothetical protein